MKKHFNNDYTTGFYPKVLDALIKTNDTTSLGYGDDRFCQQAADLIRHTCHTPTADVHFVVGGTQGNTIVISSILRPYEAVLSADTGHIATSETGAIEATGHKVITLPAIDGKLSAKQIQDALHNYQHDLAACHKPKPAMVYISQPTEFGTIYQADELSDIYQVCQQYAIPLFIDGARLGYGACPDSIKQLAHCCDVFYIGGTKCGAGFGEAIVINNDHYKADFRHMIKRQGGLLAKGRLLGVQFATLFTDNLYFEICQNANHFAQKIAQALSQKGFAPLVQSPTNQQFFALPKRHLDSLSQKYMLADFGQINDLAQLNYFSQFDQTTINADECPHLVRICTSWATQADDVDELIVDILNLQNK